MTKKVIAILLAAGSSRRMGKNKLELPLGRTTVGHQSLEKAVASIADHTIVALKQETCFLRRDFPKEKWSAVICGEDGSGQSASIRKSVEKAEALGADAVIILLADQPFINVAIINQVIETYKSSAAFFVAACFQNVPQPPVLFSACAFDMLKKLTGDQGAGLLLKNRLFSKTGLFLHFDDSQSFFDIDTPFDYEQARKGEIK